MTAGIDDPEEARRVTDVLQSWWQGDAALDVGEFYFLADPAKALQEASRDIPEIGFPGLPARGFAITSQTCEIVKDCLKRPTVQVARIVEVEPSAFRRIKGNKEVRYAYIPGLEEQRLVADFDHVMTVEKSIIADWQRVAGCRSDAERREFAATVVRYYTRWAFPDDFNADVAGPLREHLRNQLRRAGPEGEVIHAVREFRARARGSWDDPAVEIEILVIPNADAPDEIDWFQWCAEWQRHVLATEKYVLVELRPATLTDLSAEDYLASDWIDLQSLSEGRGGQ